MQIIKKANKKIYAIIKYFNFNVILFIRKILCLLAENEKKKKVFIFYFLFAVLGNINIFQKEKLWFYCNTNIKEK